MTNLTDLLPAGAGGKQVSFVASGTLSSGQTVALNSDGTVSAVAATNFSQSLGSRTSFNTGYATAYHSAVYDSANNKVVISYQDQTTGSYGTAVVGTVSGTSISFGTPVVFESANSPYISSTFDSVNNKVVIAYRDGGNSDAGTAIVGTVSGTSISFGSPTTFSTDASDTALTFDSSAGKVVLAFRNNANSNYGTSAVGTVSGTSISFGSLVVYESANSRYNSATFDSANNKAVISYADVGNSSQGTAIVGTVAGTTISFGSAVVFETGSTSYLYSTFDSNLGKVVNAYRDGSTGYGNAVVGTVSGTSISFGTPVVFEAAFTYYPSVSYNSASQSVVIAYQDDGNSGYGTLIEGTVSGTSITFGTPVVYTGTNSSNWMATAYDSDQKVVVAASFYASDEVSDARVWRTAYTDTNVADFIGIADAAISDTASGNITIKGGIAGTVAYDSGIGAETSFDNTAISSAITYDANAQKVVVFYDSSDTVVMATA